MSILLSLSYFVARKRPPQNLGIAFDLHHVVVDVVVDGGGGGADGVDGGGGDG